MLFFVLFVLINFVNTKSKIVVDNNNMFSSRDTGDNVLIDHFVFGGSTWSLVETLNLTKDKPDTPVILTSDILFLKNNILIANYYPQCYFNDGSSWTENGAVKILTRGLVFVKNSMDELSYYMKVSNVQFEDTRFYTMSYNVIHSYDYDCVEHLSERIDLSEYGTVYSNFHIVDSNNIIVSGATPIGGGYHLQTVQTFSKSGFEWTPSNYLFEDIFANDHDGTTHDAVYYTDVYNITTKFVAKNNIFAMNFMKSNFIRVVKKDGGGNWDPTTMVDLVMPSSSTTAAGFGDSFDVSSDGTKIVVGAPHFSPSGGTEGDGRVFIFEYDGSSWGSTEVVNPGGIGINFGRDVMITESGKMYFFGANDTSFIEDTSLAECMNATWTKIGSWCYMKVSTPVSWNTANSTCAGEGFQLVTLSDVSKATDVKSYMSAETNNYHIGLYQPDDINWFWVDGKPLEYSDWASGEPNDFNGNEDCTEMNANTDKWNDINCVTANKIFVCEYYLM